MFPYVYHIVNVFADPASSHSRLTGNPLCVFENARGMSDATMQALALQFNLSETVFVLPSDKASARIRIFTTAFEMPFAGHPTLGSAHVVSGFTHAPGEILLETAAGVIPVKPDGDTWTLTANAPQTRPYAHDNAALAQTLGITAADITDTPLWVSTGNEQLVVRLASADAVRRCRPDAVRMAAEKAENEPVKIYVWASVGGDELLSRFFLMKHGAVYEDHGTGSAAANLGGWYVVRKPADATLPLKRVIRQGEPIGRPAKLLLDVDGGGGVHVGGYVVELGKGSVTV